MNRRRLLAAAFSVVVAVSVAGCGGGSSGAGKNLTIRIGMFPVVSPIPVMQQQKQLEKEGYTVKWVPLNAGLPGAASALAAGKLDFVYGNSSSGITIFAKSPNVAEFVGRSFVNLNQTVASTKSGITSAKQLAGRKVVVSGAKTASTLFYEIGARKAGVTPDRGKYFVSGTGPGMVGVMASGGADVAAAYVPYSTQMIQKGIGRLLYTESDALGIKAPGGDGMIVRRAFAEQHPQAVVDVLRAQFAANDAIKNDPAKYYGTIGTFAKVDVSTVKYAFTHGNIIAPSYPPDVTSMEKVGKLAQQYGYGTSGVNLEQFAKKFANTSYAKKALASS